MVSKIFHYRSVKKNNAYLQLILVQYANQELSSSGSSRLFDYFQAALNNNLLRIAVVKFTEAETDSVYED